MAEGSRQETKQLTSPIGLSKIANSLNTFIEPLNRSLAYIGAGVLGGLVLMLMYSIIGRRLLNAPLKGSFELTELCLVVITFTIVAYESMGHEKMTVDIVSRYFPARVRSIVAPVIYFLVVITLGILCWQLIKQGIRVQGFHQTTRVVQIPIFPFLYLGAFGVFTLIPVYLVRLLKSLDEAVRK